jgi:PTS system nitrogen regulatory IIA component
MKLSVKDAAKMLDVTERDVYRWIRDQKIPVHQVNDQYRFHRAELLEWANARGMRVSSQHFRDDATPSMSEALELGGVHYDVPCTDRDSALRAVVGCVPIDDEDREFLDDFLLARESLGSTGVGDGIAIPHVRTPIVLSVSEPSITLCFLARPVDFRSIDGRPVETVFMLVSRTIPSHLYLLSRISAALHDEGFKQAVLRRSPKEEILDQARRVEARPSQLPPRPKKEDTEAP